jgi:hypothetical protein
MTTDSQTRLQKQEPTPTPALTYTNNDIVDHRQTEPYQPPAQHPETPPRE